MKFNVYFEKERGSHWVLSNGTPIFKSPSFETRPNTIDDLVQFVTLMESPIFTVSQGEDDLEEPGIPCAILITLKQQGNKWRWDASFFDNGKLSKIARLSEKEFDTLALAKENATLFCNAIVSAPILDQADVAIPNVHFDTPFAKKHHIGDIHPSSKWFK
ncbi:hypothetical protein ACX64M_00920 [Serratia marcescens]